ncbi:MAG: pyridoxamine 5'-phosphate oxidase [Candidatus Berkiella sp.]
MTNKNNDPQDYYHIPLSKADLSSDPIKQFESWFKQAKDKGELEPSAMTLATTDKQYHVTARMVLLKSFNQNGFAFFTNYLSPKAKQLENIQQAALVFWWPKCQRQVRITGLVSRASAADSDSYFNHRSKESQIAAIVSAQSSVIKDRNVLIDKYNAYSQQAESSLERPDYWGGYVLKPTEIEFWQGREHRLHDRFQYLLKENKWEIFQLSP